MRAFAAIKVARAIRRLTCAITPGTDPSQSRRFISQAMQDLTVALDVARVEEHQAERRDAHGLTASDWGVS